MYRIYVTQITKCAEAGHFAIEVEESGLVVIGLLHYLTQCNWLLQSCIKPRVTWLPRTDGGCARGRDTF